MRSDFSLKNDGISNASQTPDFHFCCCCTLPFSLCMESASYVFSFRTVFSTLWPRAGFLTSAYVRIQSISQKLVQQICIVIVIADDMPLLLCCCFLHINRSGINHTQYCNNIRGANSVRGLLNRKKIGGTSPKLQREHEAKQNKNKTKTTKKKEQ